MHIERLQLLDLKLILLNMSSLYLNTKVVTYLITSCQDELTTCQN